MPRSKYNQELHDRAYRDIMKSPSTHFAYGYLLAEIRSGRYTSFSLAAIAEGIDSALKESGYP